MNKPYLSDMISNHKARGKFKVYSGNKLIDYETPDEWKIQLTMSINFVSSKNDSDESRNMHTKNGNVDIFTGSETDEIIEELFGSFLQNHQKGLEESMKGSYFIVDSVDSLYYHLDKISLGRKGRSYIDSPKWLESKKATIKSKK